MHEDHSETHGHHHAHGPGHGHGHQHDDKKFKDVDRLRQPERLERLEVGRVMDLCREGLEIHSALDIGTGSGVFAEAFAGQGLEVAGIDENPSMLEAARRHVPGADLRQASAESLPFAGKTFDLAFLGLVLHEVDDPARTLAEARRVSRERVAALEWPYREEEAGPPLAHRLKEETVRALAEAAGFTKVETLELKQLVLYRMQV